MLKNNIHRIMLTMQCVGEENVVMSFYSTARACGGPGELPHGIQRFGVPSFSREVN